MNKLLMKVAGIALGLSLATGIGVAVGNKNAIPAYADSATITFADQGWSNSSTHADFTISSFRFLKSGTGNAPAYYTSDSTLRYYNGNTLTISPTDESYTISAVSSNPSQSFSVSNNTATVSFSATVKFKSITITYTVSSGGPVALTNPNPQYDDSNKTVSWTSDQNATKYQIKIDSGNYSDINTETYDASGLETGIEHTVYIKAVGNETDYTTTEGSVTFTPSAPFVGTEYTLCTSTSDLEVGAKYIFTNGTSGTIKTMSTESNTNNRRAVDVDVDSTTNRITSTSATLELELGGSSGSWTFETLNYLGTDGYFASGTGNNNHLRVETTSYACTISFSNSAAVVTFSRNENGRNIIRYNANNGSPIFACYSSGNSAVYLWKEYSTKTLESLTVTGTPTKLSGYYDSDSFDPTGISSIVANYDNGSTKTLDDSDILWTELTEGVTSVRGSYTENEVTVYTPTYTISAVLADALSSISISGTMTNSYNTNDNWDKGSLVVTAHYLSGKTEDVTSLATLVYYSNSGMSDEVETPADLGIGNNQTIYVKATYSAISNATGYSQTVSVVKAPTQQTKTINFADVSLNDGSEYDDNTMTLTSGVAQFVATKGSGTKVSNYVGGTNAYTHTRLYNHNSISITANGNVIKELTFTVDTPSNLNLTWTNGSYSLVNGKAVITANANATALSATLGATTQFTSLEVVYYAPDVAATGITINGQNSSSVSITPYQTTRLVASVLPLDATDRTFEWSLNPSGANAIVTIDETGHVEPIAGKYGPTTITATSNDGSFTATCTVTVEHVSYHQAVYDPTSTTAVSTSGTLPDGESHTFSADSFNTGVVQLTTNNPSMSLTLSGYAGQKIRTVILKMHSNVSGGAGTLSVVAGSTTIASIASSTFAADSWNGEFTTDWVLIEPTCTQYDVQNNENIVITVTASANSLYIDEIRIQYEASEIDTTAVDFAQLILDDLTCDDDGIDVLSTSEWEALNDLWDDGTTVSAAGKQTLLEAVAAEHNNPSTDEEIIEAAMAKYDYIVAKYNKTLGLTDDYPDFIGRNPAPLGSSRAMLPVTENNETTGAIITVVSLTSVAAIGGYFFLRKRRLFK